MALRNIREQGEPVLNKICKPVTEMTPRIKELIEDMLDTMYDANGVGLAAPQVGILKRIFVVDCSTEEVEAGPYVFVNPVILETSRPNYVKIAAYDKDMNYFELEATELLARAICHENDHLDGHLYVEKVEGPLYDVTQDDVEETEE